MLKFNAFRASKRISVVHSSLIIPTNPTLTPIVARRNATTKATTHPRHASRPPPSEWRAVKGSSSTSTSKSVERTRETQFGDGMPSFMDLDSWPTELDPEALELDRQRKQEEQQRQQQLQQQSTIHQSTSSSLLPHLPPTFTKATVKDGEEKKAEPSSSLPSSLLPPEVVNPQVQEALRDLYSAVARNELGQVVKAYHRLRVHHGLEKFVDADVTKVSQMLTDYLSHAPVRSEERKEAEEMSIFFCTRGVMAPLNEAMAFHLRSNNSTRIFELWDKYDRWGKKPIYLAGKRNMSIDDRMLYVCAAAAITNEFTWIYHAMSTSSTVFPDWRVNDFVQRALTGYEPAVRQRFRDFLHDAMLTRDVDLFYPLASQVREAGEHGDYEAIEALCRNIRDGIERGLLVPGPALDPKVPKSTWSPRIVDERVWTLLVYGAVRSRKVDVAGMIVQEMKAVGVRPSIRIWNYILMGMVKTGAQPRMLQVLNKMREDGHEPDLMSQTIVLRALFDKRSLAQARGVFLSITGSIPSDRPWTDEETTALRSAYNVVLNGLLRCQLIEEADKVFATMGKEGPAPDVVTFNTLLNRYAHMKLPQKVKETLHIMGDRNISPDIYTFTILFVNACHLGDDAMKHILMERMRELDIKANTALLSAAIYSILANGENDSLKHAMQLLRLMEKSPDKEARPNEITYNTILHKIRQQIEDKTIPFAAGHEQMEKIYDGMKRRMFRPNRVTLHVMMKQYLTHPHPDSLRTATAIFNELCTERVDNDDTWYIFLHGLNRRGQFELVAETIRKLQQRQSIQPKKSLLALVERLSWRI